MEIGNQYIFFFSSRRRHTRLQGDWSSDVCSSDLSAKAVRHARPRATEFRCNLGEALLLYVSLGIHVQHGVLVDRALEVAQRLPLGGISVHERLARHPD